MWKEGLDLNECRSGFKSELKIKSSEQSELGDIGGLSYYSQSGFGCFHCVHGVFVRAIHCTLAGLASS